MDKWHWAPRGKLNVSVRRTWQLKPYQRKGASVTPSRPSNVPKPHTPGVAFVEQKMIVATAPAFIEPPQIWRGRVWDSSSLSAR